MYKKFKEDLFKGFLVRSVCKAIQIPNSRLSNFLSRIVNDYTDLARIVNEFLSSEEINAALFSIMMVMQPRKENMR